MNKYTAACLRSPHCPRCKYPCNGPDGQPYLGIYDADRPCASCGYKAPKPPSRKLSEAMFGRRDRSHDPW